MRELSIADVLQLEDKELIPSIKGTVKVVFDRKSGTSAKGPWSVQGFVLSQGDEEITCGAWNMDDDLKALKGSEVTLSCWKGDKGLSGVYAQDDEYNGNITRKIRLTKTAQIAVNGSVSPQESPKASAAPKTPATKRNPVKGGTAPLDELAVRKNLNQLANFDLQCGVAADYTRRKMKERGLEMTAEEFQARWSSYFITGTRENWHRAIPAGDYHWPQVGHQEAPKPAPVETPKQPEPEPAEEDGDCPF